MIWFLIKSIFENVICEYCIYIISTLSSIQFNSFHAPNSKTFPPIIATFMCCAHTHPNKFISCFSYLHMFWAVPLVLDNLLGAYTWEKKNLILPSLICLWFFVAFHIGVGPWEVSPPTLKSHLVLSFCRSCLAIVLRFHVYSIPTTSRRPHQTAAMLIFSPLQSFHSLLWDILWSQIIGVTLYMHWLRHSSP